MRINHNIQALNAYRQLSTNQKSLGKQLEKLSSGLRITRAADDAAGLAISEKMRSQIRGLEVAERNAMDGISLVQTAEGALNEIQSMLQRTRELAVQAANGTLTDTDRDAIQQEVDQLAQDIDRIVGSTNFNGRKLLRGQNYEVDGKQLNDVHGNPIDDASGQSMNADGNLFDSGTGALINADGSPLVDGTGVAITDPTKGIKGTPRAAKPTEDLAVTMQIGANSGETMSLKVGNMDSGSLKVGFKADGTAVAPGADAVKGVDVSSTQGAADKALAPVVDALNAISIERSKLGAYQNRLEHSINNISTTRENMTAAESRIRDADMAIEMAGFTKSNIINQAATAMLAQANQLPQGILQLLQ